MINFHQLRAWRLDGVDDHVITHRLADSDMSKEDILNAWSMAFEVSPEAANAAIFKGDMRQESSTTSYECWSASRTANWTRSAAFSGSRPPKCPPDARTAAGLTRADIEVVVDDD